MFIVTINLDDYDDYTVFAKTEVSISYTYRMSDGTICSEYDINRLE